MDERDTHRLHAGLDMAEALRRRPDGVAALTRLRMACVGCVMAPFDTVGEAAAAYGMSAADLVAELERAHAPGRSDVADSSERTMT